MKTTKLILIASVLLGITTSSCKKDKVKGCTSSSATNYDSKAEEDDGSCKYSAKAQFWFNSATSDSLSKYNWTLLKFYVDNVYEGEQPFDNFFAGSGSPSCSASAVVLSTTKDLGASKTKTYSYKVVDDNSGDEIWTGSVTYDATQPCTSVKLEL